MRHVALLTARQRGRMLLPERERLKVSGLAALAYEADC